MLSARTALLLAALFAVASASPAPEVLETQRQGPRLLLDWSTPAREPARFRILHPDGRLVAVRDGKRSVQGWLASLRVAGWPPGHYLVEAEAGEFRSSSLVLLQ